MATKTLRPNGAGDLTELTPYPSPPNYNNVNDAVPNDDLYNKANADDKTDLYNIDAFGVNVSSISKIRVVSRVKALNNSMKQWICIKTHSAVFMSYTEIDTGWQGDVAQWYVNPATLVKWTAEDIENLQIGVRANASGDVYYVSDIYVEITYTPVVVPTVTTQEVSDIDSTEAIGHGNITDTGTENATKRGICYGITENPTVDDNKVEETGDFGTGAFTANLTDLLPGQKYYVRAYAYNSAGYSYGAEVDFTTDIVAITIITDDPTDVLETSVTANGNITSVGGSNATVRGFKYGLTQIDTWDTHDDGDFEGGTYTKEITGLTANTIYWIRAYATNTLGTSYGEWVKFQTSTTGVVPTGTKVSICSDNSGYTYQLNASLTDDGNAYESHFTLSTDLADKQGLHFKKRLLDLFSYFTKKSGTCKIYIKQDNEEEWQYCGEISMDGNEDIMEKHLPSENEDSSGDVDYLAKHYLIKFVFWNDFEFIGLISDFVPIGVR